MDEFPQRAGKASRSHLRDAAASSYSAAPAGHGARVGRSLPSGREGRKPGSVGRKVDESATGPAGFFVDRWTPRARPGEDARGEFVRRLLAAERGRQVLRRAVA